MDFFNKLGKKTTEAYQSAKEKTTKISGELKLKGKISEYKEKINQEYKEIGKMVYEKMKAGEDASKEDITPKCEEIERLKVEIEKAEVEILALKDIKKCADCGAELELKAEFCSKCGSKQPVIEKVEIVEEDSAQEAENAEVTEVTNVEENNETQE
jgi:ribosomal protein L40E